MNKISCTECYHYEICKIIEQFKNALVRHKKIFIPREDSTGPTDQLMTLFAKECRYYIDGYEVKK